MGALAVDLLVKGETAKMVGMISGNLKDFDIDYALSQEKTIDRAVYELAGILAI